MTTQNKTFRIREVKSILELKKDLRKAKTMRHSEIIADIVHTHYSNLKTKSHRNVSIKWLREKNLLGKA